MGNAGSLAVAAGINTKCRAVVVIPARNEERRIALTLRALERQKGIEFDQFEIILFLNNCTDGTAAQVARFCQACPQLVIHVCEGELSDEQANIGTVRRMLMNKACERLLEANKEEGAILTTDADTCVDQQWIAQNLEELRRGVDLVGGRIFLNPSELRTLSVPVRRRYYWETAYSLLLAKLESQLDPLPWNPWPRHHQNFCGSLAISACMYRRVGGVPAVETLEDIALCDAVLTSDGKIRHSPDVRAFTSARLAGRVQVGLSSHLQSFETQDVPMVENVRLAFEKFKMSGAIRQKNGKHNEIAAAMEIVEMTWQEERKTPICVAIHELGEMVGSHL